MICLGDGDRARPRTISSQRLKTTIEVSRSGEVGGRVDRDGLVALGCLIDIIAYTPRLFIPVDRPEVVQAVLRRHLVQTVLDGVAA